MALEMISIFLQLSLPGNLVQCGPYSLAGARLDREERLTKKSPMADEKREDFLRSLRRGEMQAPGRVVEDVLLTP
jgi:hypothetical protein